MEEEVVHAALGWSVFASMFLSLVLLSSGIVAPYGRYSSVKSFNMSWGVPINARLAWVVQEIPALAIPLALWASSDSPAVKSTPNCILLALFCAHYFNRSVIFPLSIRGGKPTPLGVAFFAFTFCVCNGYLQGRYLTKFHTFPPEWLRSPCFLVGVGLMIFGAGVNIHSDHVLRNLRRPGETGYKIPHGGMFRWVSGANFFGEIVEWSGFALACGGATPAVIFAASTAFNIGPRAVQHHKWYTEKFKEAYPQGRKALIPYVW